MVIDKSLFDTIPSQAKASPRLRQNYDLRNSEKDNSQRMLNALEPVTVIFKAKDGKYEPLGEEDVMRCRK